MEILKPYINGEFVESKTDKYMPVYKSEHRRSYRADSLLHRAGSGGGHCRRKGRFPQMVGYARAEKGGGSL